MTEAEWLSSKDALKLLAHLNRPPGDRKLRLYGVACCRRLWHSLSEPASREAIEWAERFADGLASVDDEYTRLEKASAEVFLKYDELRNETPSDDMLWAGLNESAEAAHVANAVMRPELHHPDFDRHWQVVLSHYVRELFGNPFAAVTLDASRRTPTVVALAEQMYESRDFSAMPLLSDALMDAGCFDEGVLNHCRQPGEHVRGCWVVDLILGRE